MKSTIELFLIVALFVSTAFAEEDDMGNGGCLDEGDMGNGGITCTISCETDPQTDETCATNSDSDSDDSILGEIQDYLNTLFG